MINASIDEIDQVILSLQDLGIKVFDQYDEQDISLDKPHESSVSTDDPVRLTCEKWVELTFLLAGEIEIAKRIEKGIKQCCLPCLNSLSN